MNCKKCNKEILVDSKFCTECGSPIENVEEIKKEDLKGFGGLLSFFVFSLGLSIILNAISGFTDISSILKYDISNPIIISLAVVDIIYWLLFISFNIYALYLISNKTKNAINVSKMYLLAVFVTNLMVFISSLITKTEIFDENSYTNTSTMFFRSLIFSLAWFIYLTLSKRVENTFPTKEREFKNIDKALFGLIITISLAMTIFGIIGSNGNVSNNNTIPTANNSLVNNSIQSNQDFINSAIEEFKSSTVLPSKIDDYTTISDITAEKNAIRYHMIYDIDSSIDITDEMLKNSTLSNVCPSNEIIFLLKKGINIEYSYKNKDNSKQNFISISKDDCNNN